jgi:uncharacterized membrane protein
MPRTGRSSLFSGSVLFALSCLCFVDSARADSLSCNDRIVSSGDSRYRVRSICGDPDDAWQRVEYRTMSGRVVGPCYRVNSKIRCKHTEEHVIEYVIDVWTYDFGKSRFVQYLTFEQGQLVRVESGSYGHKP